MTNTRTADTRAADTRAADTRAAATEELPVVAGASEVTVNGVTRPWTPGLTVEAVVLDLLQAPAAGAAPDLAACATGPASAPTGVAAALDDTIVPRGLWASTSVPAGARVEVVTAVQGG